MFTLEHFIFLGITFITMGAAIGLIFGFKPKFKLVFTIACILCVISEVTKTLSVMEFDWLPLVENGVIVDPHYELVPFIRMSHVPLHLCSIQILFIFLVTFMKPTNKVRDMFLAFMYPTFIIGAALALLMPSDTPDFSNPQQWQYFLYHGMLIVLGIYIITSKEIDIRPKHYLSTLAILGALGFFSIYFNSMFSHFTYDEATNAFDIHYMTTFFFTMRSPVSFLFTFKEPWHWYLYLVVIAMIAVVTIALFYIPVFIKGRKNKHILNESN